MNILVVDDEKLIRMLLSDILEAEGHAVHEARTGLEALNYLRTTNGTPQAPTFIVTDDSMPEMNGLEFLLKAKEEGLLLPPFVLYSDLKDPGRLPNYRELGMVSHVCKPGDPKDITTQIPSISSQSGG